LWAAQAVSQTAQNAIWYGLLVVVEETTQSSAQMGVAILTTILPSVFLGMVAGAIVDRLKKNSVLIATNFLRAFVVLGYLLYGYSLTLVYLVNLISSTITQFFGPAEAAKIPQLVGKRQLINANSLFNLTFNGSQLAGMVILGPPLVKILGPAAVFIAAALSFAVAGFLAMRLPPEQSPEKTLQEMDKRKVARQVWADILVGWRFITADRRTALAMLHLTMASALMLIVAMLAPRYVVAILHIRADDAVFVLAPAGIGILTGTLMMSRMARRFQKESLVSTGILMIAVFIFLLSIVRTIGDNLIAPAIDHPELHGGNAVLPLVMLLAGIMGFAIALVIIPSQTILMERAPTPSRGRIFSVQIVLGHVASVAPLIFVGNLADAIGIDQVIALLGLSVMIVWIISTDKFALLLVRGIGDRASVKAVPPALEERQTPDDK
jgi:MFS family permease